MLVKDSLRIRVLRDGSDETWVGDNGWFRCQVTGQYSRTVGDLKSSQVFSVFIYIYR